MKNLLYWLLAFVPFIIILTFIIEKIFFKNLNPWKSEDKATLFWIQIFGLIIWMVLFIIINLAIV